MTMDEHDRETIPTGPPDMLGEQPTADLDFDDEQTVPMYRYAWGGMDVWTGADP